jgi:hypothetical protein
MTESKRYEMNGTVRLGRRKKMLFCRKKMLFFRKKMFFFGKNVFFGKKCFFPEKNVIGLISVCQPKR